ncbi:MAG: Translation initiation factor 1, partial [uncultured Blastococcus sp.]
AHPAHTPPTDRGGHAEEGRGHRDRGPGGRTAAQRDVPGGARERPPGPGAHQRQDAAALHPHPSGGPRGGGALALRPHPRPHRLPLQV